MLLTVPQKYLKELLNEFGALKIKQAKKLIRMKIPDYSYYKTIKPLIAIGDIKEQGEYILDSNGIIDADIITAIDKEKLYTLPSLKYKLYKYKVGETITVHYTRNGKSYTTKLKLTA